MHSGPFLCIRFIFFFLLPATHELSFGASECGANDETLRSFTQETEEADDLTSCLSFLEEALPPRQRSSKCSFAVDVSCEGGGCGAEERERGASGQKKTNKKNARRLDQTHLWRDFYIHNYFMSIKKTKGGKKKKKNPNNKAMWLVRVSDAGRLQKQAKPQSSFTSPTNWQ